MGPCSPGSGAVPVEPASGKAVKDRAAARCAAGLIVIIGKNGLWPETRQALYNSRSLAKLGVPIAFDSRSCRRMAKSKKKVETVFLVCDETGDYNYTLRRKTGGEKLKLMKYSSRLRKHTLHTEKKK
jgi:large subunit ribosomal protein L33